MKDNNLQETYIPPIKGMIIPIILIIIFLGIFTTLIFVNKDVETEKTTGRITGWDDFYSATYVEYEVDGVSYEGKLNYYNDFDFVDKPVVVEYEKGNPSHLVTTVNLKITYIIFDIILVLALIGIIIYSIKYNSPPDTKKQRQTKKPNSWLSSASSFSIIIFSISTNLALYKQYSAQNPLRGLQISMFHDTR